ncbi:DUF4293 domain-containing protein [Porphyromonas asaccharolytica]|uniref:DUF4293 family protein n=1 Tax=Porphyromonas asaccharolytica (strain ATCC 25260 / DSM 20707 / BCRC 10618 / CCUG 7834 / JCM 6326 / LMG 13178 / VPI 4198 / B440) TaxID=879243 RepID=F4KK70_PORAD|nr:DUF4293 domain-containing protein [Porphyromonas asaccharolytica]AEE12795.1 hypothetical protein Poras_0852 [Porphyromonas asaccharolytica DSM 20707]
MWQRIQTLYLFLSGVTATLLLLFTLFTVTQSDPETIYAANFTGLIVSGWTSIKYFNLVSFVLTSLVTIISFVTIFLYKRRKLQIRLTIIGLLLMVAAIVAFGYMLWRQTDLMQATTQIRFWIILPIINLLCQYLAMRNIIKDDILVRASNRLR